jgi:light-regulated signal transduction histidine kinase (bacteriophytochrome)
MQPQSKKSDKIFDEFLYVITHDLKAPLRAISNLSTWIEEDLSESLKGETRRNFQILRSRVARMEAMITGVCEYANIPKLKTTAEHTDLSILIEQVLMKVVVPSHIQVSVALEVTHLYTSRPALFKVLYELISNAVKFNDKEMGYIKISSRAENSLVEFSVEDNGSGIPRDCYEKIFIFFQTLHAKDKIESTGMGLPLAKRIVEDFEGHLGVDAESGCGSKFFFTWSNQNIK